MAYKRSRQAFEADLQKQESPFVFYGTPLPPLDSEVRDDGSFVPIWRQEVTDDRGRKRLHGAFTGGFSAGYYNTVGSKEGWTPSTFVSSRQNRMKDSKVSKQMRPEDFMDEEDLREAEESRQLQTSDTYEGFGTEHDERRRDALIDLFRPSGETIGVTLLRKMGWKEGQTVGQRMKPTPASGDGVTPSSETHSFAGADVGNVTFRQKGDRKGLGYEGEESNISFADSQWRETGSTRKRRDDNFGTSSQSASPGTAKKPSQKAAFGVGVLNDTGSDDEDPYSMGPQISYTRIIGSEKKKKTKTAVALNTADPALKSKPVFLSKKLGNLPGVLRKCHDGRLPPDGFILGDDLEAMGSLTLQSDRYKPPEVPSNWTSSLVLDEGRQDNRDFQSVAEIAKSSSHDSKSRASLLGETQLPGKSVFDYLSPAARDRLVQASGRKDLPHGLAEKPPEAYRKSNEQTNVNLQELVPKLDQEVALQALNRGSSGWMPYGEDESKKERYKRYLEIRAGFRATSEGDEIPPRPEGMGQEEWVLEMQEFARAAQVFKPVTGMMASRFTSSSTLQPSSDIDPSVATESLLSKARLKPEDPAEAAARIGMFGPMTRSFASFYPTRLVCKRFNIPMPEHTDIPTQSEPPRFTPDQAAALGKSRFQSAGFQYDEKAEPTTQHPINSINEEFSANSRSEERDIADRQVDEDFVNPDRNEALEKEKPGRALFKAIFGSDDEGDDT